MEPRFIVAEITKNWTKDQPVVDLLSQRFEKVINVNYDRGYILKDWKLSSVTNDGVFTETIISIFEKRTNGTN